PESAAAALLSPVSTAARNSPNSGPRIAFRASVTPAPSSSRMRRVSPSRCNSLVASAARISAVRCACACRHTASRETLKRSATARLTLQDVDLTGSEGISLNGEIKRDCGEDYAPTTDLSMEEKGVAPRASQRSSQTPSTEQ